MFAVLIVCLFLADPEIRLALLGPACYADGLDKLNPHGAGRGAESLPWRTRAKGLSVLACKLRIFRPTHPDTKKPRTPRAIPKFLRDDQLAELLLACDGAIERAPHLRPRSAYRVMLAKRDRIMVWLSFFLGLRVSEIRKALVQHVDLSSGEMLVVGKGKRERLLPIPSKMLPLLRDWIGERKSGLLFTGQWKGLPLTVKACQFRFNVLGRAIGLPFRMRTHMGRHTAARRMYLRTKDIELVQRFLGHAFLSSTAIYLEFALPERLREAVEML